MCIHWTCKSIFFQQVRTTLGLALHRGWVRLVLGRCRDRVKHPNQPRPTAAEATVEDDEETHAFYHHPYPPGYGG